MRPLSKIGFPAHDLAMMMSIALRFIPAFTEETDKIMKAQASRGSDFESGNIFARIKSYVPILVPLVVGAFKRAEDMAVAMESRCYRGGEGRTKFKVLTFGKPDVVICIMTLIFGAAVIVANVLL
jgi:energy-coupling factor transport system permease protein